MAQFSITNQTWAAVGSGSDIPGPITALEVNNLNATSLFAAGQLVAEHMLHELSLTGLALQVGGRIKFILDFLGWNQVGNVGYVFGAPFPIIISLTCLKGHPSRRVLPSRSLRWSPCRTPIPRTASFSLIAYS